MLTIKTIQNEIRFIPINRLEEVYKLICSFHRPLNVEKLHKAKILKFAGMYNDMSESDYNDLISYTDKCRNDMFNRSPSK